MDKIEEALATARAAVRRSSEHAGRTTGTGVNCFEVSELREAVLGLANALEALASNKLAGREF